MWKQRGGVKQRLKNQAVWDYHRRGSPKAIQIMERYGWKEEFGLGDGKGRLGKYWGHGGYWAHEMQTQEVTEVHWGWSLTTAQGAVEAFRRAGQPFGQVSTSLKKTKRQKDKKTNITDLSYLSNSHTGGG